MLVSGRVQLIQHTRKKYSLGWVALVPADPFIESSDQLAWGVFQYWSLKFGCLLRSQFFL